MGHGSGDPVLRAPPTPLENGRAFTQAFFFRLLIVRHHVTSARARSEVAQAATRPAVTLKTVTNLHS